MSARKTPLPITYEILSYPDQNELLQQARRMLEQLERQAATTESVVTSDEIGETNTPNNNILHP